MVVVSGDNGEQRGLPPWPSHVAGLVVTMGLVRSQDVCQAPSKASAQWMGRVLTQPQSDAFLASVHTSSVLLTKQGHWG